MKPTALKENNTSQLIVMCHCIQNVRKALKLMTPDYINQSWDHFPKKITMII